MNTINAKKEYSNNEITVLWESAKCIHSANCVKNLSSVFKPKEQPWVQVENAATQEIVEAVGKCPSGALSIKSE